MASLRAVSRSTTLNEAASFAPLVKPNLSRTTAPLRPSIIRLHAADRRPTPLARGILPGGLAQRRRINSPLPPCANMNSSSSEGSATSDEEDTAAQAAQKEQNWGRKAMQLPLEVASLLSNEDSHYLEKRGRTRWWRRKGTSFPLIPKDTIADASNPSLKLWQKVLPLGIIFFGASFNLAVLQSLKDAIMVTTAGAETLPFLASLGVLPASLAFFVLYGRMVEALPSRMVFYAAIAPLVAFYAFFAAVLYPTHGMLHPTGLVDAALSWGVPTGLMGLVKCVQYWTFSLFYCSAELWGSVVISVLFWSLANEVCTVAEAKSVYPLMGIAANIALVLSGSFVKLVNRLPSVAAGSTHVMLSTLVGGILAMTAFMMLSKATLDNFVIGPYCSLDPVTATKPSAKKKKRGSLADSLQIIRGSSKITSLAVLVVSYGISHRLFEFSWKGALRTLYPTAQGYQGVLADVSIATGWATITFMLLGKFVFQYLGWRAAASATPIAMLVSGGAFFGLSLAASYGISVAGMNPVAMAFAGVAAGGITQVFARSSKFSLFDPAKEMVYIEMSQEEKSKGKAAVDLLGSQIGKSGGAWITQLLLLFTGSLTASLPIVTVAFTGVIAAWLTAVGTLNKKLQEYEEEKKAAEAAANTAAGSATAGAVSDEESSNSNGVESGSDSGDNGGDSGKASTGVQPQVA